MDLTFFWHLEQTIFSAFFFFVLWFSGFLLFVVVVGGDEVVIGCEGLGWMMAHDVTALYFKWASGAPEKLIIRIARGRRLDYLNSTNFNRTSRLLYAHIRCHECLSIYMCVYAGLYGVLAWSDQRLSLSILHL